jgi:glycosyltransferase involved in cell wall biosynthesis
MKKLLYVVNVDWFFISHRLPIALKAIESGYQVHVSCAITDKSDELKALGFILHPLELSRSGTGIWSELAAFWQISRVLRKVQPDVAHFVTIKPVLYGGICSRLFGHARRIFSISGLGYVFIAQGFKAKCVRSVIAVLYRLALGGQNSKVIFQNPDDQALVLKATGIAQDQATLIRGSGVDLSNYVVQEEPTGAPVVMLVARLLFDKGVGEFVAAASLIHQTMPQVRMVLVGDLDQGNPKSVSASQLASWVAGGAIEHWGYQHDIAAVMAQSHVQVLPSYREGLPKSLIEAAACGRAVVTTDVPGCRDAIVAGQTGLLVPMKEAEALAQAIMLLLADEQGRKNMGTAGRLWAEQAFDIRQVVARHLELYQ